MRRLAILIILVATAAVAQQMPAKTSRPQSDAQKAFEKMKTLAGSWEGSIMGMPVQVTIRVTSSGNAILHEGTSSGMKDNPITMLRSEEHTSELQSHHDLVCRLLLEKKKK